MRGEERRWPNGAIGGAATATAGEARARPSACAGPQAGCGGFKRESFLLFNIYLFIFIFLSFYFTFTFAVSFVSFLFLLFFWYF